MFAVLLMVLLKAVVVFSQQLQFVMLTKIQLQVKILPQEKLHNASNVLKVVSQFYPLAKRTLCCVV